jgi:hypothetical protein
MLFQAMVQWNLMGSLALPSYHFAHLLEEDTDNLLKLPLDRALAEVAFHIAFQAVVQVAFHIAFQAVVQVAFQVVIKPQDLLDTVHTLVQLDLL